MTTDLVSAIGVLGPDDKLLIHLKENVDIEGIRSFEQAVVNIFPNNQCVIFSGDIVEKIIVVPPIVDPKNIVYGSRQILEDMRAVTGEVTEIT